MDKNGVLTISDFQKGQAESPYLGFDTIRAVDITSTPGVAKVTYKTEAYPSFTPNGLVTAFCRDTYGNEYHLVGDKGSNLCTLYKEGVSVTDLSGYGYDLLYYKGYILIRHGSVISAYETQTGTLFTGWKSGYSQNYYGKMLVSKNDGNVYIADGTTIKRLSAFVAGSPLTVAPTATADTAIQMISGYAAVTIAELGSRLMVGAQTDNSIWVTRYGSTEAVIFPYRIGVSATNFDNPIKISNANSIQQLITSNNLLYIMAGMKGNLYVSDGTSYRQVKTIPFAVKDEYGLGCLLYPNAITIGQNGNLLIGTSSYTNGYSGLKTQHGIYEVNLASGKYETNLRYVMPDGAITGQFQISIGCVDTYSVDQVLFSWQKGSSYGFAQTSPYRYGSYIPTIETQLYSIGTKLEPKKFQNVEFTLGAPLSQGQGIKLYYRGDTESDYTLCGTYDYSTYPEEISIRADVLIPAKALLQLKIEMTVDFFIGVDPSKTIELLYVRIW